jgi:hypothetical protein
VKRSHRLVLPLALALGLGASLPASAERIASKPDRTASAPRRATSTAYRTRRARRGSPGAGRDRAPALGGRRAPRAATPTRTCAGSRRTSYQVQAAGAVPQYIWILLAVFLAVSIIVMIV